MPGSASMTILYVSVKSWMTCALELWDARFNKVNIARDKSVYPLLTFPNVPHLNLATICWQKKIKSLYNYCNNLNMLTAHC
jgi:hypothetical protein